MPRGSRDAPGRSAQRGTRARRRGRGPAADAPRAGTSGDTALRGGARRRPRGRRARRGGAGAQHARRVSLRPWRARRGRGLPARGARDRARAAAVARHRSCLREPGRLRRPGRPDRRGRTPGARRRRGRPVARARHGLPRDAADRRGAAQVPHRALGRRPAAGGAGARAAGGRARGGGRARDDRPGRGRARRPRRRPGGLGACAPLVQDRCIRDVDRAGRCGRRRARAVRGPSHRGAGSGRGRPGA